MTPESTSSTDVLRSSLSAGQALLLQGVIPIVLVGIVLPIGLIACFLGLEESPLQGAVKHGELFLAAGNAAFTGCVVLVAARSDIIINAVIASFVVLITIVVPGYACWALLTVQGLLAKPYSESLAIFGGGFFVVIASVVALTFVKLAYRPVAVRST